MICLTHFVLVSGRYRAIKRLVPKMHTGFSVISGRVDSHPRDSGLFLEHDYSSTP